MTGLVTLSDRSVSSYNDGIPDSWRLRYFGTLNNLPHIRVGQNTLAGGAVVAAILAGLVTLVGAVLGGLAGMRYHRKVDRAGLRHENCGNQRDVEALV